MLDANTIFGLSALAIILWLLIVCYRWWWHRLSSQVPEALQAIQASASAIEQLEQSIGGTLPNVLKTAYLDGTVTRVKLPKVFKWDDSEYSVDQFFQADARANRKRTEWGQIPAEAFIFAEDDFGNEYFVKANDNAVYFWAHDLDGDVAKIFDSADDFWKLLQVV